MRKSIAMSRESPLENELDDSVLMAWPEALRSIVRTPPISPPHAALDPCLPLIGLPRNKTTFQHRTVSDHRQAAFLNETGRFGCQHLANTVEPLTNDHPHQRPSLSYDHILCDGQSFLFIYESLTSDHPSYTTTPM